uniref:Uncharacterized protein n=1 Tax=Oryza rufipogon TaxID=4529 RepID=A0A0E0PK13_ORYRU
MAEKTLREFTAPSTDNVPIGPQVNVGDGDFDLKTSLITMAQASPFCASLTTKQVLICNNSLKSVALSQGYLLWRQMPRFLSDVKPEDDL